jgi:xanthine dehydrogenase accessory factor
MIDVLIRGGGDLASGIALRLHHAGLKVVITEIQQPLAVRRLVSFAEAVYERDVSVEDVKGLLIHKTAEITKCFQNRSIPVVVDEDLSLCSQLVVSVVVDARMLKRKITIIEKDVPLRIGIGPGFYPGDNCDCVIETKRGPYLGRVFWKNPAESDNGIPEMVAGYESKRVLRSPESGRFHAKVKIGDIVEKGDTLAMVNNKTILAPFRGLIRGLIHDDVQVTADLKVGDIDPRCDPLLCGIVSDKSLAIGGGVLEAIFSLPEIRGRLYARDDNATH